MEDKIKEILENYRLACLRGENEPNAKPVLERDKRRTSNTAVKIRALFPKGDKKGLLTPGEQDKCVATKEQLDEFLSQPDDRTAASLSASDKIVIAKCILYGQNLIKAQQALDDVKHQKEIDEIKSKMVEMVPDEAKQIWDALKLYPRYSTLSADIIAKLKSRAGGLNE